jgi:hypothetical protein
VLTDREFVEKRLKVEKERIDRRKCKEQCNLVELETIVGTDGDLLAA